jgi:neutral ceramidase
MATIGFGIGVRDITPLYPVMLHGYSARDRLAGIRPEDRVSEPTSVRAMALAGSDGKGGTARAVIVVLDMIGVHAAESKALRQEIAHKVGLDARDVLLAATHTHFAPTVSTELFTSPELGLLEPDPRFVARVTSAAVEAAAESLATIERGTLETYRVPVPSALFNRRTIVRASGAARTVQTNFLYPEHPEQFDFSPVDPELAALRLSTLSGPKAVLMNFGCHPVTGGLLGQQSQYRISADYPYHARRTVEQAWGCPALFTLGSAGDAVPMNRAGHSREQIGAALGNAVLLGERAFAASGRREGEAVVASRWFEMPVKTIVAAGSGDAERAYGDARSRFLAKPGAAADSPEAREFRERANLAYRARMYPEDRHSLQIQLLRVGETVFVALPFEVLSEISLKMKRAFPQSVLVSIANGYQGYLPFAYEYERGGYEASADSTHFEIGTADRLLDRVLTELRTM